MNCPECKKDRKGYFDRISIDKRGRCVQCHIEWGARPENDPECNAYKVSYRVFKADDLIVYAKSKEEAEMEAWDRLDEDGEVEIQYITELAKPDWKQLAQAQIVRTMGEPAI